MKIRVMDRMDAARQHGLFDFGISIFDPSVKEKRPQLLEPFEEKVAQGTHIILFFADDHYPTYESPEQHHFHLIDLWLQQTFRKNPASSVLIHCHAGISRSTAVAIYAEIRYNGLSIKDAYDRIHAMRDICMPNNLLIQYADERLDLKGELIEFNRNWKETQYYLIR